MPTNPSLDNTITKIQLPGQQSESTFGVMANNVLVSTTNGSQIVLKTLPDYLNEDLAVQTTSDFVNATTGQVADAAAVGSALSTINTNISPLIDTNSSNASKVWKTNSYGVPAWRDDTDTDTKVTQTPSSENNDYEILFSGTANNNTQTEGAKKNSNLTFNPSTGNLQVTKINGATVGSSPKFSDTTYTGSSPISISGTTISHIDSGVTAASKGDTSAQTPTWGGTFKVPSGTVNATGHLTAFADHNVTIPNAVATTSAAGLMSATDKEKLNNLSIITTRNLNLSDSTSQTLITDSLYNITISGFGTSSSTIKTYNLIAPSSGWIHGIISFTSAKYIKIYFYSDGGTDGVHYIGSISNISISSSATTKTYEFDILNSIWIVHAVS